MDTNLPLSQVLDPYATGHASGMQDLYQAFLGPPRRPAMTDPYEKTNYDKFDMPEAYAGRNLFLRDTVEDWMFTANQTWYTERALPWRVVDDIHVAWTEWEANAHYLGLTPHEAGSRVVTQRRTTRRASLARRGLAAEFEHDFVKTALGRQSFFASLGQIARSVQETSNMLVIQELVNCQRYQHHFLRQHGIIKEKDLMGYLERDRDRFAIVQKKDHGLDILDVHVDKEIREIRGSANAWIVTEAPSIHTLSIPAKTEYFRAGPAGPARIAGETLGPLAQANTQQELDNVTPLKRIRQNPVFVARSFVIDGRVKPDLLTRMRQIGTYLTMMDECADYRNYTTKSRAIMCFNEDLNDFSKIELEEAIRMCGLWDGNGELYFPNRNIRTADGTDLSMSNRDLDRDFLTYSMGGDKSKRHNIQYIGDIAPEFFTRTNQENAGLTVLHSIYRGDMAGMKSASDAVNRLQGELKFGEKAIYGGAIPGALNELVSRLKNLFGGGNLILSGAEGDYSPGKDILPVPEIESSIMSLLGGLVPVTRQASGQVQSPMADNIHKGYLNLLSSVLPPKYQAFAKTVREDETEPLESKIEQLKSSIMESVKKGENEMIESEKDAEAFFKKEGGRYQEKLQKVAVPARESGGQDIAYAKPGNANLPDGWRYVHEHHARAQPKSSRGDISSNILHFPGVSALIEAKKSEGDQGPARRRRMGARRTGGGGVTGIGAFDFGEDDRVIREQQARRQAGQEASDFLKRFNNLQNMLDALSKGSASTIVKIAAAAYLGTRFNMDTMLKFAAEDVVVPMNFLLFRPHQTYKMHMAIKLQLDGGAGNTFVGHSDMQIEHDGYLKIGRMHYTTYIMPVVTQPRNVYVQEDIYSEKYMGGNGIKFYKPLEYQRAVKERAYTRKDIICAPIPYTEKEQNIPKVLDISGRFYTEYKNGLVREDEFAELHYTTAYRMNLLYDFYNPLKDIRKIDQPNNRYGKQGYNRICWRGCQMNYNPKTGEFDRVRVNQGHWGPNVYPGCGDVRNGQDYHLRPVTYTNTSFM